MRDQGCTFICKSIEIREKEFEKLRKDCECRKGDRCANGLKCELKNCFLIRREK